MVNQAFRAVTHLPTIMMEQRALLHLCLTPLLAASAGSGRISASCQDNNIRMAQNSLRGMVASFLPWVLTAMCRVAMGNSCYALFKISDFQIQKFHIRILINLFMTTPSLQLQDTDYGSQDPTHFTVSLGGCRQEALDQHLQ